MKHIALLAPVLAAAALAVAAGVPSPQAQGGRTLPSSTTRHAALEAHPSQHVATDPHASHLTSLDPHAEPYAAGSVHGRGLRDV